MNFNQCVECGLQSAILLYFLATILHLTFLLSRLVLTSSSVTYNRRVVYFCVERYFFAQLHHSHKEVQLIN